MWQLVWARKSAPIKESTYSLFQFFVAAIAVKLNDAIIEEYIHGAQSTMGYNEYNGIQTNQSAACVESEIENGSLFEKKKFVTAENASALVRTQYYVWSNTK